jgi:dienelactone hydrolase
MDDLASLHYQIDGIRMTGRLATPRRYVPGPAILLAPEAPGITENALHRAQMLAKLGYTVLVADIYGDQDFPEDPAARHAIMMTTPHAFQRRAEAALEALRGELSVDPGRVGAVGFCQGGITILELARTGAELACAIGFHPGLARPAGSIDGAIRARILMMLGDDDPVVPETDRAAFTENMRLAGADWQLHLFGGVGHAFTNQQAATVGRPGFAYHEVATQRAWKMMADLLRDCIGG